MKALPQGNHKYGNYAFRIISFLNSTFVFLITACITTLSIKQLHQIKNVVNYICPLKTLSLLSFN